MEKLFIFMGIAFAVVFFVKLKLKELKKNKKSKTKSIKLNNEKIPGEIKEEYKLYEYRTKAFLLTQTEIEFYKQLKKELTENMAVSLNVRVADVMKPTEYYNKRARQQIQSLSTDFIIYDKESFKILFAIELDDLTHDKKDRKEKDKFKDYAYMSANISLYRVKVKDYYIDEIRDIVDKYA